MKKKKNLNGYLSKEDIQMVNEYMKRYLAPQNNQGNVNQYQSKTLACTC